MTGVSVQIAALSNGYSAAKSIFEITERSRPSLPLDQENNIILDDVQGCIRLDNVDFSYPARNDVRIYNHLTLEFPAGKTTAIIGASGCGKSMSDINFLLMAKMNGRTRLIKMHHIGTVVNLIERWYDVDGGSISLDGVDIRRLDVHWLRKQIGLVSQVCRYGSPATNALDGTLFT